MPAGGVDRVQALLPAVAGASFAFAGWQSSRTVAGVDAQAAGVFVVAISLSAYLYARAFKHQGMRLQQTLDLLAGLGIKTENTRSVVRQTRIRGIGFLLFMVMGDCNNRTKLSKGFHRRVSLFFTFRANSRPCCSSSPS